jgi:hypothetical protein
MKGYRAQLLEQLKAAKAQLTTAKGTDKVRAEVRVETLAAQLEAYKKVTEKHVEHQKTSEEAEDDEEADGNETDRSDDPEDDDGDGDDKGDDKKKSAAATPKKAAAKKSEEDDEEDAEAEGDEAEALAAQVRRATGKRGVAAQGAFDALVSKARSADALAARIERLERDNAIKARDAVVDSALAANRITKKEAAGLRTKPMAHVGAFLEARPRSLVHTSDEELLTPAAIAGGEAKLPPELEKIMAMAMAGGDGTVTREKFLTDYAKTNGVKGTI